MTDVHADGVHGPSAGRMQLRVGRLLKAHGLKGALKLELYTDDPDGRFVTGATFTLQVPEASPWHGRTVTVREFRWINSHPVVFLDGVTDRTTAEQLVKAILWVQTDPAVTVEPDAWYDHQLIGLGVVRDGVAVGHVARVDHLPAQDLLVVHTGDRDVLVPFVKAIVPEVDIANGRVVVTPPDGLFEDADEASEPRASSDAAGSSSDAAGSSPDAAAEPDA